MSRHGNRLYGHALIRGAMYFPSCFLGKQVLKDPDEKQFMLRDFEVMFNSSTRNYDAELLVRVLIDKGEQVVLTADGSRAIDPDKFDQEWVDRKVTLKDAFL